MLDAGAKPLEDWRQGDVILAPFRLPVLAPSSNGALAIRNHSADEGIAIISQSCDVVKDIAKCPWIQVAPLVKVDPDQFDQVEQRKHPRLTTVPALRDHSLAIDLDFCCSIEKQAIAHYDRVCGCPCDQSQARLSEDLARHRGRFAFPDDFNAEIAAHVKAWFKDKVKRDSPAAELARQVTEVRVLCDDLSDPKQITLWLMLDEAPKLPLAEEWMNALNTLARRASKSSKFPDVDVDLIAYGDISAAEYRSTYLLNWEDVS